MSITIATLLPTFTCVLGALFLFISSNRLYINRRYLALFVFNSFLLLLGHFVYFHQYIAFYHRYDFIFIFSLLSLCPLYYLYIKSIFDIKIKLRDQLLHFLLAVIVSFSSLILSINSDYTTFSNYFFKVMGETEVNGNLSSGLFYVYKIGIVVYTIQILFYSVLIIYYILKRMKQLKNYFFEFEKKKTISFVVVNSIFLFFMIILGFITIFYGRKVFAKDIFVLCLFEFIFFSIHLMLCLYGLKQIPINTKEAFKNLHDKETVIFSKEDEIKKQMLSYFEKERPWSNPNLRISDLTFIIGTNRTYISKIVNYHLKSNFNDFVNGYRIEEAITIMKKKSSKFLSLQEIAENSGFKSDSTFRRAFKKYMGETASEYYKKVYKQNIES